MIILRGGRIIILRQNTWLLPGKVRDHHRFLPKELRRGRKRAVMAVAHSILIMGYAMLKTGRSYYELGGNSLERINKDQVQRYFLKRLQRLGRTVTLEQQLE